MKKLILFFCIVWCISTLFAQAQYGIVLASYYDREYMNSFFNTPSLSVKKY